MLSSAAPRRADVVDVRDLAPELRMEHRELYAAVLALTDAGLLEYVGAGPRVRITSAGFAQAKVISPGSATG